nr:putative 6-phosphogluconolactonase [uncultured bacterium]
MSSLVIEKFGSREALDEQLVQKTATLLSSAVEARGSASLVVSGGSTPLNFFNLLSQQDLPWDKVTITLADERWVAPVHSDSNEKLVREKLLVNNAARAKFLALKNSASNAEDGESECEKSLEQLGCLDLLILGMGADGHTASLFPGAETLPQALDMNSGKACIAVQPLAAPHQRMSMTLPRLLNANEIVVHITGANKKEVLDEALQMQDQRLLPISAILQQRQAPVAVYWAD